MKITFLLTQSLEDPSGLGRYFPLTKELARLGNEVSILALHPNLGGLSQPRFQVSGVQVHYVGQMHVRKVGSQKTYFSALGLVRVALASTLRMGFRALLTETDVIHLAKPHPINGVAALGTRFFRGKRLYLDCDDYEADSNRFSGQWQRSIVALFEDNLPRFVSGMTVNTRFTQQRNVALGFPVERIVYVPNGVDRERFAEVDPERVQALRRELGLDNKRVIAYVGSMSLANHPVDLLLEAFAIVRRRRSDAVLILAGGGQDYDFLRRRAEELDLGENAIFVGRVKPEAVPYYLAMADVSVDPVRDDLTARARSPLKVFESFAVGTPVVTGDVGDRRDILGAPPQSPPTLRPCSGQALEEKFRDGEAGVLVKAGSAQALAEGILAILEDGDLAHAAREAALRLRERYYWDVLVREFVRVYRDRVPSR
jgi:glycosyltransferase involved in cell wall biosynthesis